MTGVIGEGLNNILLKGWDVVRQYAVLFERLKTHTTETAESGVDKVVSSCEKNPSVLKAYTNFLRQRKTALDTPLYAVSSGRSMIEMLGVLAIIGVLSVGGIAGYSKAMEKWRVNKLMEEYSYMIQGILGHLTEFQKLPPQTGLVDVGLAMNFIPSNWEKISPTHAYDTFGNIVKPYVRDKHVVIDFYLGRNLDEQKSKGFSPRICASIMKDLVTPLHSLLNNAWIFRDGLNRTDYFRGDTFCTSDVTCLRDITLDDINRVCKGCDGERLCSITIEF